MASHVPANASAAPAGKRGATFASASAENLSRKDFEEFIDCATVYRSASAEKPQPTAEGAAGFRLLMGQWPGTADNILQLDVIRGLGLAAHGGKEPERDLDFIEVFAGEAAVTKAFRAMGHVGGCMDLCRDERHNVLQPIGLMTLLGLVMRLRPRGLLWLAPVCSTWVFMSRGSTGRHESIAGRWDSSPYILAQNALSCRMAAACLLVASLVGVAELIRVSAGRRGVCVARVLRIGAGLARAWCGLGAGLVRAWRGLDRGHVTF